jgi:recombination protein RecT
MTMSTMRPADEIRQYVETNKKELAKSLPNFVDPERFFKLLTVELVRNPAITKCDPSSVIESIYQCARLGLNPGPSPVGRIHLVPYGNTCTPIIDYTGLMELAKRGGHCKDIRAYVVYANEVEQGRFKHRAVNTPEPPHLYHEPIDFGERGEPVGAYAIAFFDDRQPTWQILSLNDIEKTRTMSRSGNSPRSPWSTHWEAMAKKTAIRRLCKFLDLSDELGTQLVNEDDVEYRSSHKTTVTPITVAAITERGKTYHGEPEANKPKKKRGRPTKAEAAARKRTEAMEWLANTGLSVNQIRHAVKRDGAMPSNLTDTEFDVLSEYVEQLHVNADPIEADGKLL